MIECYLVVTLSRLCSILPFDGYLPCAEACRQEPFLVSRRPCGSGGVEESQTQISAVRPASDASALTVAVGARGCSGTTPLRAPRRYDRSGDWLYRIIEVLIAVITVAILSHGFLPSGPVDANWSGAV